MKNVPAFIDPPGPFAPMRKWIEYRSGLDRLEAELRVSFPDLAWLDAMQPFKDQADKAILSRLIPEDRGMVERLMADHPDLTAVEAIADLTEYGGL